MSTNLFEALGGEPAIAVVVDDFYRRLVADPIVEHHFRPERLDSLKAGQRAWFRAALTPGTELPTDLGAAHAELEITDEQVEAVLAHLAGSLGDAGVADGLRRSVLAIVGRLWFARQF